MHQAAQPQTGDSKVGLTCITCKLLFDDATQMREHYKKEFHRFNLKRKGLNLPPVPEALYDQKVASMTEGDQAAKGSSHLKQGKPRKATNLSDSNPSISKDGFEEKAPEAPKTEDELIEQKIANAPKLTPLHSLFDNHVFKTVEANVEYMTKEFGFYLPAVSHLADLEGLLGYLGQKIAIGNTCIYCDKGFYSLEAVRSHMVDTTHCKMQWDDQSEYEDWYKFPEATTIAQIINENGEIEDSPLAHIEASGELVLADGKILGHRAYRNLYTQNKPTFSNAQLMTSLLQEHKRLAAMEYQKRVNMDKKYIYKQHAQALKNGLQNNNQKHYRDQNPII